MGQAVADLQKLLEGGFEVLDIRNLESGIRVQLRKGRIVVTLDLNRDDAAFILRSFSLRTA